MPTVWVTKFSLDLKRRDERTCAITNVTDSCVCVEAGVDSGAKIQIHFSFAAQVAHSGPAIEDANGLIGQSFDNTRKGRALDTSSFPPASHSLTFSVGFLLARGAASNSAAIFQDALCFKARTQRISGIAESATLLLARVRGSKQYGRGPGGQSQGTAPTLCH
jgi:hypothetical protein